MYFATAALDVSPLLPLSAAFGIALLCSLGGISGAFLLLPFQITVLGYVAPGVSATNHIFNIIACPSGVWRYAREGRLLLPLTLFIAVGTLPGVFLGAVVRLIWLDTLQNFLLFVALVLLYVGARMAFSPNRTKKAPMSVTECTVLQTSWRGFSFRFAEHLYHVPSLPLLALSGAVGLIGGIYGIGGGAIMSPFLVAFFGLPVYAIAGACLFATFLTSLVGVACFTMLAHVWDYPWAAPDWGLGLLLGIGGMLGMYCGASLQRRIAPRFLRYGLTAVVLILGLYYLTKGIYG